MTKVLALWESKAFKVGVMVLNVLLIVALVGYIVFLHTGGLKKDTASTSPDVATKTYTEEELNAAMERADENMVSIYGKLIPGSRAEFQDGNTMSFGADGKFEGYFNAENTSIEGKYVVTASDDDYLADVNIYNGESSDFVQYKLMYDDNKDFMLYYPAGNAYIALVY